MSCRGGHTRYFVSVPEMSVIRMMQKSPIFIAGFFIPPPLIDNFVNFAMSL